MNDKDTIYRQAAINTAEMLFKDLRKDEVDMMGIGYNHAVSDSIAILKNLPTAEPRWIPVKTRPMDEEERAYWSDHLGYDIDYEDALMFDCKMPDDGQEILVSFRKWVNMDKCEIDGGLYGLEGNGDWDGVVAWMPLPKPWKGEDDVSS